MSEKNEIKAKAKKLQMLLKEKDHKVKNCDCIEIVSQLETGQCYNVAKDKAVRILKGDTPLTFKEMKSTDFSIDVVIPVDLDIFMAGMEALNDYASDTITGNPYALHDISYEVYPYHYGQYEVAVRVTGYIGEIDSLEDLEDYEEPEEEED